MTSVSSRPILLVAIALSAMSVAGLTVAPNPAHAHGGDKMAMTELSRQPARALAQQALAELRVRNDTKDAALRLDAALESRHTSDVDMQVLRKATETLDAGDPKAAVPLIDEALSRPLGASSGKSLHEAGREFQPGTGPQEVVGIIAGAVLLALGVALLLRTRLRSSA